MDMDIDSLESCICTLYIEIQDRLYSNSLKQHWTVNYGQHALYI